MLVGYARVSTDTQVLDPQLEALRRVGVDDRFIFKECISALSQKRTALAAALNYLREGDTLIVYKLDRLSRSLSDLIKIMSQLGEKKVNFKSLTENIETETAAGKMMFHIIATFAEFERNIISERTREGIRTARANGVYIGGQIKVGLVEKQKIKEMLKQHKSKYEIARSLGLKSRSPIYTLIRSEQPEDYGQAKTTKALNAETLSTSCVPV